MNYRPLRVGKLIREELGIIMLKELEFPGAIVTITDVEVDKKLENAKIMLGVIPIERAEDVLEIAERAKHNLQHLLLKKMNIKPMPRIRFEIDYGQENAAKVEKVLLGK